jgi:exodeoxyribonuclease V gamma subunit
MHFSASKNVNSRALLSLWLNHLALCATRQLSCNEISQLIIPGSGGVRFEYLEAASAKTLLANYIRLFQQGLRYPLPVFPNTSYTWASQADPDVAMSKALGVWHGGNYRNAVRGEREDEFIRLALHNNTANPIADELFQQYAREIYCPAIEHGGKGD